MATSGSSGGKVANNCFLVYRNDRKTFHQFFRLWTDPADFHDMELVPKDVFNRMAIYRNQLIELGLKAEPIFPKYCAQNPDECV